MCRTSSTKNVEILSTQYFQCYYEAEIKITWFHTNPMLKQTENPTENLSMKECKYRLLVMKSKLFKV